MDNTAREQGRLRAQRAIEAGKLRASSGAAGLSGTGSVGDLLSSGDEAYLTDQNTLLSNERNTTYDTKVSAANYQNQANAYNSAADNVKSQARRAGFITLLGTAASIAGSSTTGSFGRSSVKDFSNPYSGWDSYSKYRLNRG